MGKKQQPIRWDSPIPFFTEKTMTMFLIGGAVVFVFGVSYVIGIILEDCSG